LQIRSILAHNTAVDAQLPISIDHTKIAAFCLERSIRKLSLFGSVLREDFSPASDVDVLIEFLPGKAPGLAFFGYAEQLAAIVGRAIDLNTPGFLNKRFRDEVLTRAVTIYEQA
jgi:predicted nucleotidyltransferase